MPMPDPPEPERVIDLRARGDDATGRDCPSCGTALPPRRLFCTDYCRTALHRIRRTEADIARLRRLQDVAPDGAQAAIYAGQIATLVRRAAARDSRLAAHRTARIDLDDATDRSDVTG